MVIIAPNQTKRLKLYSIRGEKQSAVRNEISLVRNNRPRGMGHANRAATQLMTENSLYDMNAEIEPENLDFEICVETKAAKKLATRNLVDNSDTMTIHTDICGPFQPGSFNGTHRFVTFTDTPHRYTRVKLIRKS